MGKEMMKPHPEEHKSEESSDRLRWKVDWNDKLFRSNHQLVL